MRQREMDFLRMRSQVMNEFHHDQKQFTEGFDEVTKLNEDLLASNPYGSPMNLDNHPTHRTAEGETYCAASKYYKLVDSHCKDRRSLHYAGEDRVYLLFRRRGTGEWEFPTRPMFFGQSFLRSR